MSRAQRLLELMQILRRHQYPVRGAALAAELGVSLRTLYRDIATLQAQGARIDGEPGLGYLLRPGFLLPPLMFSEDEIEALALGSRWVADRAGGRLATAAASAMARIGAVLPPGLRDQLRDASLFVPPGAIPADTLAAGDAHLTFLRQAIRREHKLRLVYRDLEERETTRTIWPIGLAFFERARIVAAWCELRQDFRHFRCDRISALEDCGERYPRRRQVLQKEWREHLQRRSAPSPNHS